MDALLQVVKLLPVTKMRISTFLLGKASYQTQMAQVLPLT